MTTYDVLLAATPSSPPAGGAALGEVLLATALGGGMMTVLLVLVWAHRTRRTELLQRAADRAARLTGQPGWAALPTLLTTPSLLTALFGMLWDISLHIDNGRDPGPLANPAHFFILFGLFGVFAAGVIAVCLPREGQPGPSAVRITRSWSAPVGGLLLTATGLYSLMGFPLDDIWHRLFGQDVTLWGPTHLMLISGAGLSLIALLLLEQEGRALDAGGGLPFVKRLRRSSAMGGLLIGLSVYQAEFDFGVPQFRLVMQPLLIAAAAGLALVAARIWNGKGGALLAVAFFLVVRGLMSLLVGPVLGETTPSFPLYLGSAVLVELVALRLAARPVLLGAVAGALVGTVGTAVEAVWTQSTSPLPWTSDIAVEGTLLAAVAGVAGGLLGALLALGLQGRLPSPRLARPLFAGSVAAIAGASAVGIVATVPTDVRPQVVLTDVPSRSGTRFAQAAVTFPRGALDDPSWVQVTAWQGGGLYVSELDRGADGVWRTRRAVPVSGEWKTLLRVHDGRSLSAAPVWLPGDAAIRAAEVPALSVSTRPLQPEIEILQRERDLDVPSWLWAAANLVVLVLTLAMVSALGWGVARVARRGEPRTPAPSSPALAGLRRRAQPVLRSRTVG